MPLESSKLKSDNDGSKKQFDCGQSYYNNPDELLSSRDMEEDTRSYNLKNTLTNRCKKGKENLEALSKKGNSGMSTTFMNKDIITLNDENNELKMRLRNSLCYNNINSDQIDTTSHNNNFNANNTDNNNNNIKRESNLKLEGILNENDYLVQLNKLRRHVIVEIFAGKCFIREYLSTEFLKRVKQCCNLNYVKNKSGLINYRDCKQLLAENNNIASIEARLNAILVSLPPLISVILHSSVFLVIKEDLIRDDLIKSLCNISKKYTNIYNMNGNMITKKPFEFCALECVFSSAIEHLNAEMQLLNKEFSNIKLSLKIAKYQDILSNLHNLKEPTSILINKVNSFIKAFREISENNVDLKRMELTKCYFNPNINDDDNKEATNQDLQMLLEYFDQELHQSYNQIKHLHDGMINLEAKIVSDLSLTRNNLIRMDIIISLVNSGFGIGTLITGVFGMNLKINLETNEVAFLYVTGLVVILCLITVIMSFYFFKCIRI
ncbi:CorA-like Mg2+ transporter protein, putative [Plasmodium berghei]|uniref:Magnesium transporter n=2 Tax=Plasmodium berghei TaxID=5821 RepID=A0A509AR66_PLABA|nr:CorA-like Mg2+ transporter protein, putative [Plasmodium berghei ANKA]CXJ10227.1 CorA-like Mg2+ transporter protein, putative [Plasmodium berghei]SCM25941.1 CorA-like Mg2+ transporter protein, putative [Plasmodium berghei]SCN28193.1 CorA-like Mg2+ transporter protein, putative [Plasmodium berghei]SCO62395.1 CorA-like Mg2+ transporter protein, putative [Plasmodium berghei]SCO63953.1 CorA-like Mg2+ transporter protein, putative [Plasmodium berghei]|eukprot:XP_034423849.1 CorA-like Mg2+ transporter protein, putative [Plasmodium berghei ANKA]